MFSEFKPQGESTSDPESSLIIYGELPDITDEELAICAALVDSWDFLHCPCCQNADCVSC